MKTFILLLCCLLATGHVFAQSNLYQYFDGTDTLVTNSIIIHLDTPATNTWQIGKPQKTIFNSAATLPNAIVTDTINSYPPNDSSRFSFQLPGAQFGLSIIAVQWKQMLDLEDGIDGGIIEYSVDSGHTWVNVFNSPDVYSFYGFSASNVNTLASGVVGFTGKDTVWRDVWLCIGPFLSPSFDIIQFRYTMQSDTSANSHEGWMIDNMNIHKTFIHTAKTTNQTENLRVYPSPTTGIVNIEAEGLQPFHIDDQMELFNAKGQLVERFTAAPVKYFVDISKHPDGLYFLKIKTKIKSYSLPIVLKR
jgi:hypothetical protein